MKKRTGDRTGAVVVLVLGIGLTLGHLVHAVGEGSSFAVLLLGIALPMAVSGGVVAGGLWLWRRGPVAGSRRVGGWAVVCAAVMGLGGVLTAFYQRAHGVQMVDPEFAVLNSASFGALAGLVVGLYDTERHRRRRAARNRERALDELHATTRALVRTSDRREIAERAVEAARDILDLPVNTCWFYDDEAEVLTPVASTDEATRLLGEMPVYSPGDSLSWEAFETGDLLVFDDVSDASDRHSEDTPIRSEVVVPLGDHGVMNVGSTEVGAFDEIDVSLVRILGANTRTALERADRERELARTRDEAERLNDQLTVLNRVFRHDLRNAANVIRGHADLLVEAADDETAAAASAATIRDKAADLVEMGEHVQDIERVLQRDDRGREVVDLVEVVAAQLDRIRREHPAVEADGPDRETCRVYAHPLVASAVENVLDNAVEHNDEATPRIEVSIGRGGDGLRDDGSSEGDDPEEDGTVTLRIADNGPGIPDDEVAVLERGYETPLEHASGLGLWLVNWIVTESGGSVSFSERRPQGSVVRLRFEAASGTESEDGTATAESAADAESGETADPIRGG